MIEVGLVTGLAGLVLSLVIGVWAGYRYALESKKMDAVIAHALDGMDTSWEDEAPASRPRCDRTG